MYVETQKRLAQISGPKYPDGHTGKAIGKLQQNQFLNSLSIALKRSSSYLEVHVCFFRKGAEYELLHHEISEKAAPKAHYKLRSPGEFL